MLYATKEENIGAANPFAHVVMEPSQYSANRWVYRNPEKGIWLCCANCMEMRLLSRICG